MRLTEKDDELGFQLLMSTLTLYDKEIKKIQEGQVHTANALIALTKGLTLQRDMIKTLTEMQEAQRERIKILEGRILH